MGCNVRGKKFPPQSAGCRAARACARGRRQELLPSAAAAQPTDPNDGSLPPRASCLGACRCAHASRLLHGLASRVSARLPKKHLPNSPRAVNAMFQMSALLDCSLGVSPLLLKKGSRPKWGTLLILRRCSPRKRRQGPGRDPSRCRQRPCRKGSMPPSPKLPSPSGRPHSQARMAWTVRSQMR